MKRIRLSQASEEYLATVATVDRARVRLDLLMLRHRLGDVIVGEVTAVEVTESAVEFLRWCSGVGFTDRHVPPDPRFLFAA